MSNQVISIVYCGNQKVFDGILISLLSLAKCTVSALNIHILTADFLELNPNYVAITSNQCEYLKKQITKVNSKSNVIRHDVRALYDKKFITKIDPHCTPYTLLRLLLDLIDDIPKKIIYLDTDTIINRDINNL
jgi:lipopolysaccharide biosynthesis glycosyltransferase